VFVETELREIMKKYVIVATKGRPAETAILLDYLADQEVRPDVVYLVGATPDDLPDVTGHSLQDHARVVLLISKVAGLTVQRNHGIEALLQDVAAEQSSERWFVCFFDDDFRPHRAWLRQCDALFTERPEAIGMTGQILADGVKLGGLGEGDALRYLSGEVAPMEHWASGAERKEIGCAYGCNMAFVDQVIRRFRFDAALPLYGWQEDYDFTARAKTLGPALYEPGCLGVHLGVTHGRTSGVRFGYSQVANPLYLVRKQTMNRQRACRFISRHLLSNIYHSFYVHARFDYRGRLKGNCLAILDIVRGTIHPGRILEL
jgi:GT2 family glycosyltransferase